MLQKDSYGRLKIPSEIVARCPFLKWTSAILIFVLTSKGEIGIVPAIEEYPLPDDYKFLGKCIHSVSTSNIYYIKIPENVDSALGDGSNYFFATSLEKTAILYIYKNNSLEDFKKLLTSLQEKLDELGIIDNGSTKQKEEAS